MVAEGVLEVRPRLWGNLLQMKHEDIKFLHIIELHCYSCHR